MVNLQTGYLTILIAEDDPDDHFLLERAFEASGLSGKLVFVNDGEELLDYLFHRGEYVDPSLSPRPSCLILDINMPKKDGLEALREIRQSPDHRDLPIFVLTISDLREEEEYCHEYGISEFVTKSDRFDDLVELMKRIQAMCTPE